MELDEAIMGRRSIREYVDKAVPIELVRQVLGAGTWAPSARNRQMWRFTVLTGDAKKRLTDLFRSKLETRLKRVGRGRMGSSFRSCAIMEQAPVLIIGLGCGPSSDLQTFIAERSGGNPKHASQSPQSRTRLALDL